MIMRLLGKSSHVTFQKPRDWKKHLGVGICGFSDRSYLGLLCGVAAKRFECLSTGASNQYLENQRAISKDYKWLRYRCCGCHLVVNVIEGEHGPSIQPGPDRRDGLSRGICSLSEETVTTTPICPSHLLTGVNDVCTIKPRI
jgi:hypothetical protein